MPDPEQEILWSPHPGPQTRFLSSSAAEVLYGGAAGGGKSAASIALPLRWVDNPNFRALFLRREAKYLSDAIDKSSALYPKLGGHLVQSPKIIWTFPSGAKIWLNHCEHEKDVSNYDSLEFHLVIFEELTHFTEKQYRGIRARIRGTDPTLPRYTRATTNPGGAGHEWVFRRFGAWLDPQHSRPAKGGEQRFYVGDDEVPFGTEDAMARQFIPAKLTDNPSVTADYKSQLMDLDPVRRAQLLDGNWLVQPGRGLYFKRPWFTVMPVAPVCPQRVRAWDLAATVDGDWTVGALMGRTADRRYAVLDVVRYRGTPSDVEAIIKATAVQDGTDVRIVLPQDPGQAGLAQVASLSRLLDGFTFKFVRPSKQTGDKITRAGPASSQAQAGNISLVRGEWLPRFVEELESFPEGSNDDQVDAMADAYNELSSDPPVVISRARIASQTVDQIRIG